MDGELLAAYQRTEYRVSDGAYTFVMRIEQPSLLLHACQESFGVACSAFVTACNPRSVPTSHAANEAAMALLISDLRAHGLRWLRGVGIDPAGAWPGEPSLLVLGLQESAAVALARRLAQNAVVCAASDAVPHLVIC